MTFTGWVTGGSFIPNLSWFYYFDCNGRKIINSGTQRVVLKGSTRFILKNSEQDKSISSKRYGYQKVMAFAEVLFYCDFITFISEAD